MNFTDLLKIEEQKEYFKKLKTFIDNEYLNKNIYPKKDDIYNAFKYTDIDKLEVVILGQDPYATPGYAMGLAFGVNDGITIPKSLQNIYKEINNELNIPISKTGNLTNWSKKGILLLNTILTVEEGLPLSHKGKGWEEFTLQIIKEINKENRKIVFILLGNEAKKYHKYLDNPNHLILESAHPSPLGAYHGFFGSNIFIDTINYLNKEPNFWSVE